MTGLTATDKSDAMTGYESRLEYECQKLVTFNTNVLRYEEQPVTIHFTDCDGKTRHYTPDILVHYRTDIAPAKYWKPLLAEVKWRSDLYKNWGELKPKFRAARTYAKENDLDFAIVTNEEIKTPYLDNAIFLLTFRSFPINDAHSNLLLQALERVRETNPESLLRMVSDDGHTIAELLPTLWQLVGNRAIGVNLNSKLTMRSRIWTAGMQHEVERDESIYQLSTGRSHRIRWRALRHHQYLDHRNCSREG